MAMADFLDEIKSLHESARAELARVRDSKTLEVWRIKYLGAKGLVRSVMDRLREVPREIKPAAGKAANEVKNAIQSAFDSALAKLTSSTPASAGPAVDVTLPGERPAVGHAHLITQTINEILDIFGRMGFSVAQGPEVEDEWHNFIALNIPAAHPARDVLDNFYIDQHLMIRSQTSTIQIRVMEKTPPPICVVATGRVYRPDTVDATHSFMFHQVEGLYVDEGVDLVNLKTTVDQFCKAYFGQDVQTRFRPSFFPFTEPSAEVDLLFHLPDGSTKWIELGGCGMVDPNVLEAVRIDPEKYTGWAFGLGIERMIMRKHGIPDLRLLFENSARFTRQF
ncbi:MAG: phenylalanine--tRNA ligase subunit alpha [Planctomycetes bacterium]|nr:phenylalanine--tRNA ligase subunit alpha [Planctomycetota bacterium]